MARAAEEAGDYEQAVRLGFRAGLKRLDREGAVDVGPSITTGTVRRSVALDEFDAVANVFEVAAFSDRGATAADADVSKALWRDVFRVVAPRSDEDADNE